MKHITVLVGSFWSRYRLQLFPCQQGNAKTLTVLSLQFIFLLYAEVKGKRGTVSSYQMFS